MFDNFFDSLNPLTAFDIVDGDLFEPVSDYLSGYTSANAAQRFNVANMSLQQQYNEKNMALTDLYQRALMLDSPSIQKAALSAAGFNPLLAISGGISSPNSTAFATNPTSTTPQVQPRISDVLGSIGSAVSVMGGVSDMMLKTAQTKAAQASASASSAQAIKTLREAHSIDPALEIQLKRTAKSKYGQISHDLFGMLQDAANWMASPSSAQQVEAIHKNAQSTVTPHKRGVKKAFRERNWNNKNDVKFDPSYLPF